MGRRFETSDEHEFDVEVDQVWQAVATGPGLDCWFLGSSSVEPRLGGDVVTWMGAVAMESVVTAWDPPHRFAFRGGNDDRGRFQALEFLIEGREGSSTFLRLISSGFLPGDDWEDEFEAMTLGGEMYFTTLVGYLNHFAGRPATPVLAAGPPEPEYVAARAALEEALGVAGRGALGVATSLTDPVAGPVAGVVDFYNAHAIGVRSADALYRFVRDFHGGGVMAVHHLFDGSGDPETHSRAWKDWLSRLSP